MHEKKELKLLILLLQHLLRVTAMMCTGNAVTFAGVDLVDRALIQTAFCFSVKLYYASRFLDSICSSSLQLVRVAADI